MTKSSIHTQYFLIIAFVSEPNVGSTCTEIINYSVIFRLLISDIILFERVWGGFLSPAIVAEMSKNGFFRSFAY